MNLVAGATGILGMEVCRLLAGRGKPVAGLVRRSSNPEKLNQLARMDVRRVEGDITDRGTLDAACQGVQTLISTATATPQSRQSADTIETVDFTGQINLVDAAKAAGVKRFIYVGFPPARDFDFPLQTAKLAVQEHVVNSGMEYTILQPTFFMESWLSPGLGFDVANARATILGSGNTRTSLISYKNVAAFAAAAVDNPKARNRVIPLGGPEALSMREVVKIFEELSGKKFTLQEIPEQQLRAQLAGAPDSMTKTFAGLMLLGARGQEIPTEETAREFGVKLKSVREYAKEVLNI